MGVVASERTHKKRLSTTIFVTVLSFSILVVAVVALAIGVLFHASYEKDAEDKILGAARETASQLDSMSTLEQVVVLRDQLGKTVRYTIALRPIRTAHLRSGTTPIVLRCRALL